MDWQDQYELDNFEAVDSDLALVALLEAMGEEPELFTDEQIQMTHKLVLERLIELQKESF